LALVIGGAAGNVYDRLTLGYVVDFISLHYQDLYWPAFNVADSAICLGVGLLILDSFKRSSSAK
jgi:signal peptidase II